MLSRYRTGFVVHGEPFLLFNVIQHLHFLGVLLRTRLMLVSALVQHLYAGTGPHSQHFIEPWSLGINIRFNFRCCKCF